MDLKDLILQSGPLKVVKKVRSVYSRVGSPALFASVMLLWVTTIPQKLGSLLKQGMEKISQKVQQVLHTGQTKFYGQVKAVRRKALLKANEWLREPEVKLSGRVYKAVKDTETVELVENNKNND
jgi:hypothetical protein